MTSKEALKRLWQETAPATYMKDFDKKECCDAIEKDLEILEILKKSIIGVHAQYLTTEERNIIREWMENDKDR